MAIKLGINGFGRIGRLTLRTIHQYHADKLEVVAINDIADTKTNAHLLKWDTNYGHFPCEPGKDGNSLIVNGREIRALTERDPAEIPWKDYGVDIVMPMSYEGKERGLGRADEKSGEVDAEVFRAFGR